MFQRLAVSTLAGVMMLAACTGDDPDIAVRTPDGGARQGERGGPCFDDGQCKSGLVCTDRQICTEPTAADAGGTTNDGSVPDGGDGGGQGSDAGPDAPAPACNDKPIDSSTPTKVECPRAGNVVACTGAEKICCLGGTTACTSLSCAGGDSWGCLSKAHCSGSSLGEHCCANGSIELPDTQSCALPRFKPTSGGAYCSQVACPVGSNIVRFCSGPGGDCAGDGICQPALADINNTKVSIHVCIK